jgi:hypothetical protein
MVPKAECEVLCRVNLSVQVEGIGIWKDVFIAIRRLIRGNDTLSCFDRLVE